MRYNKNFYLKVIFIFLILLLTVSFLIEKNIIPGVRTNIDLIYNAEDHINFPTEFYSKEKSFWCNKYIDKQFKCSVLVFPISKNKNWTDINFTVNKPKNSKIQIRLSGDYIVEYIENAFGQYNETLIPTIKFKNVGYNDKIIFNGIKNISNSDIYYENIDDETDVINFHMKISKPVLVYRIIFKILILYICLFVLLFYKKNFINILLKYSFYLFVFFFFFVLGVVIISDYTYNDKLSLDTIYVSCVTMFKKEYILMHIRYIIYGISIILPLFFVVIKFRKVCLPILFIGGSFYLLSKTTFFYKQKDNSIYKTNYLIPKIEAPKKMKNIIYISLESFDEGFTGNINFVGENLIPKLKEVQKSGISFDKYDYVNGTMPTIASFQAILCGIPFKEFSGRDFLINSHTEKNRRISRTTCISDILKSFNYDNFVLKGTSIDDEGLNYLTESHGYENKNQIDVLSFDLSLIPKDHWWIPDSMLYNKAKDIIKNSKKPFFISIITTNTHGPKGLVEKDCIIKYNDMRDAYICLDKVTADFIDWLKQQPMYKDTLIVLSGDHAIWNYVFDDLNIDEKKKKFYSYGYPIYNVFLNSEKKIKGNVSHKNYTMFDFAPTLLEAAGFKLSEPKFGLGISLFSDEQTLIEKLGKLDFEKEIEAGISNYEEMFL